MSAFPRAALSRGIAGVRARTLIVNLPGSPGGVRDGSPRSSRSSTTRSRSCAASRPTRARRGRSPQPQPARRHEGPHHAHRRRARGAAQRAPRAVRRRDRGRVAARRPPHGRREASGPTSSSSPAVSSSSLTSQLVKRAALGRGGRRRPRRRRRSRRSATRLRALGYVEIWTEAGGRRRSVRWHPPHPRAAASRRDDRAHGRERAIREVLVKIEQMAPVSSTVLIEGESGTGKELVARAIHQLSPRRAKPFIAGERRRAARDAARERAVRPREGRVHRRGRAEARAVRAGATRGRSFSTRSARSPPPTQVKLLRALEEREIMRRGRDVSRSRWTCAWSRRRTVRCASTWRREASAPTCTTGSTSCASTCRRCASGRRTSRSWCGSSSREFSAQHDRAFRGISAEAMQILTTYRVAGERARAAEPGGEHGRALAGP